VLAATHCIRQKKTGSGVVVVSSGVVVVGLGVGVGSAVVGSAEVVPSPGGAGHYTPAHKRYFQSYLISGEAEIFSRHVLAEVHGYGEEGHTVCCGPK